MKEPRPALENLCCLNVQCNAYGQRGQANLKVRKIYGADRIRSLRGGCCGEEFSERKGTALFNCKTSEAQAVSVIEHLDSACDWCYALQFSSSASILATADGRRPMATEESGAGRRYRRSSLFLAGTHAALSGWTEIIASYDLFSESCF